MQWRVHLRYHEALFLALICTFSTIHGRDCTDSLRQKFLTQAETSDYVYYYASAEHRIGDIRLCTRNDGTIGSGWFYLWDSDYFTNDVVISCEYPTGSNTHHLFGGSLWIGIARDGDTLVSAAVSDGSIYSEFLPELVDARKILRRTSIPGQPHYTPEAVSEEDFIVRYADTMVLSNNNLLVTDGHRPIGIEVEERSYAWSWANAEDFIIFDYNLRNMTSKALTDIYVGVYADPDVYVPGKWRGSSDDICGLVRTIPSPEGGCEFEDTVNIAWVADDDGDPEGSVFGPRSVPHVTGMRFLRIPSDDAEFSFNWWACQTADYFSVVYDFGPRERPFTGEWMEDWREFGTIGTGTPYGDANKYYQMRNREFDYDQYYAATIGQDDPLWASAPSSVAADCGDGSDVRYLLSCGPFVLGPGEEMPLTIAFVGGKNLHVYPDNAKNLPYAPEAYYQNLDFSDLNDNATWAQMIFDNPGVDTDGDGYAGKVRVCCGENMAYTLDYIDDIEDIPGYDPDNCIVSYYTGDGVPDFSCAGPPPAPDFWLLPSLGSIRVRINGQKTETAKDAFTGLVDFEGYRVYIGRDDRESSYSLVASYDREDYDKHVWTEYQYEIFSVPFSIDSLRCLYGLSCDDELFDPLVYTIDNPYVHPEFGRDSIFYFTTNDYNVSGSGPNTNIKKVYPDQPYPSSLNPDLADPSELTDDGYFKYFEYELVIDNLLATVPYWINVTAFDFGSPTKRVLPIESSIAQGGKCGYASPASSEVARRDLKAYVYPNPYRIESEYRDLGFEGRTEPDRPDYRVRAINFANLPASCVIRIYSLDGDLIREINHNVPFDDPTASHETWNMITRNTQMVTTGLYYWTVEAESGETQIGKLVIIM